MHLESVVMAARAFAHEIEQSTGMKLKPVAYIDNWTDHQAFLIGQVKMHANQESFQKPYQMTSQIVSRGEGWVETENTRYILGVQES